MKDYLHSLQLFSITKLFAFIVIVSAGFFTPGFAEAQLITLSANANNPVPGGLVTVSVTVTCNATKDCKRLNGAIPAVTITHSGSVTPATQTIDFKDVNNGTPETVSRNFTVDAGATPGDVITFTVDYSGQCREPSVACSASTTVSVIVQPAVVLTLTVSPTNPDPGDTITLDVEVTCNATSDCRQFNPAMPAVSITLSGPVTPTSQTLPFANVNNGTPETETATFIVDSGAAAEEMAITFTVNYSGICRLPDSFTCTATASRTIATTPVTLSHFSSVLTGKKLDIDWGTSSELFNRIA